MPRLNDPNFCSLLVSVDNFYLDKLVATYPTWVLCHPELLNMPHVFVYDEAEVDAADERWGEIDRISRQAARHYKVKQPPIRLIPWQQPEAESQREEMLTGLVRCTAAVQTPYYWKLDADTFANKKTGFYYDKWFKNGPCFIANPWGYTKPGDSIPRINDWADNVSHFDGLPPVEFNTVERNGKPWKCTHVRMASWTMFGNTEWTQRASALCADQRLPFPSQDTYLSYVAARQGDHWVRVKFRQYGWEHCKNINGLRAACQDTLERYASELDLTK